VVTADAAEAVPTLMAIAAATAVTVRAARAGKIPCFMSAPRVRWW
jgi:hypothetical protein